MSNLSQIVFLFLFLLLKQHENIEEVRPGGAGDGGAGGWVGEGEGGEALERG